MSKVELLILMFCTFLFFRVPALLLSNGDYKSNSEHVSKYDKHHEKDGSGVPIDMYGRISVGGINPSTGKLSIMPPGFGK